MADVRKLPLTGAMALGPGSDRRRLFLRKGRPLDITLTEAHESVGSYTLTLGAKPRVRKCR